MAWIQEAREKAAGLIVNAGAFTHSSIAMLDALLASPNSLRRGASVQHFRRESFRHHSYISKGVKGVICGLGALGYELAVEASPRRCAEPSR